MFDSTNSKFVSIENLISYEQEQNISPSALTNFQNESRALVDFLNNQSHAESVLSVSKTFLLVTLDYKEVLGFFSISTNSIDRNGIRYHGMPYPDVPAALIGRLGRSSKHVKQGIGELLLFESLKNIVSISDLIGIKVIITDAKDNKAQDFYMKYGFKAVRGQTAGQFPFKLYLIIDTAKEAVAKY
ncbi:MAG: GNAT family N-acetyltransferase [Bacteriovoracaceae bacterium]